MKKLEWFFAFIVGALLVTAIASNANAHTQEEADREITIELITQFVNACGEDESVQATIIEEDGSVQQYMIYCEIVAQRTLQLPEE